MDENAKANIIDIIIDTEDGPVEDRVDLDSLDLDEVAELAIISPQIREYYGMRLIKELKD
jgi:hypothetical protein